MAVVLRGLRTSVRDENAAQVVEHTFTALPETRFTWQEGHTMNVSAFRAPPSAEPDPAISWVVVLTFAQSEWQAYTELLHRGIDAMLPYTLGSARRGRWAHGIVRPQYPGYLFAALDGHASTEAIRRVSGVRDLLRAGSGLVMLTGAQVESCRARWLADYREAHPKVNRPPVLKPGEWVRVPSGPFEGAPCQISTVDKSGIVCASLGKLQITFRASDVPKSVRGSAKPARNPKKRR